MKNIKVYAHYQAAIELLELMSIASLLALFGDAIWIIRDIVTDGLTFGRSLVFVFLYAAVIVMSIAFYKYHIKAVKLIIHNMLQAKVKHERKHAIK